MICHFCHKNVIPITHEQTIICRQLFEGHMVGSWPMERKKKCIESYDNKQLLDEVEHDILNYQNLGLCYLPKPKAEADNTDTRFW